MTPCREWRGQINDRGYGVKWDKDLKKSVRIHRWVVAQIHGWDAIEGKVVMHLCDNPACYRYDHLCVGSQADNLADMASKGRHWNQRKTHCANGHEYTPENTYVYPTGRRCRTCYRNRKTINRRSH